MPKYLRILFTGLGCLVGLLLIAALALRVFFPPAKLRRLVENQIRGQLNREARLGDVRLGLRGLTIDQFKLSDVPTFSAGTFLEVDQARVRWSLLPFRSKKVAVHLRRGSVHMGDRPSAKLTSTLSDIDLRVRNFSATQAEGQLTVKALQNPSYKARDFSVEWALKGLDANLGKLNGWMRLKQGPGLVHNLDRLAASSRGARLALMPLVTLQKLDRMGFVRLGLPDFSRLDIEKINGRYTFKDGTLTIDTFDIVSPQATIGALGTVDLVSGRLGVDVTLRTPKPTLLGEMDLKMRITGTLSEPKTNLDHLKKKAFKATVHQLWNSPDNKKKLDATLKNIFH
ncbi:MAG: type II secretion system protein GspN [Elusimicrobia bacterium RIFCSPLOWO2_01_FULL_59_12]|nr:MAG: type II secretion system protein GspN [Elusimicrobia bacterium RIFCSPLOWO2_01_FULL_59_12]